MRWCCRKSDASDEFSDVGVVYEEKNRYSCLKKTLIWIFVVLLILLVIVFFVFPLIFMYCLPLQTFVMFPNFDQPENPEYNNFAKYGTDGVRNLYVSVNDETNSSIISLGVWHVLPEPYREAAKNDSFNFDNALNSTDFDVIIYFHGNSGTRIYPLPLYEVLRNYFHVIAMDYRGYGDSTDAPRIESGVVNDLQQFYKWVRTKTPANIYVWGHSLGTALSTHTVAILNGQDIGPTGLILEAPFTTMREEIPHHPFGKILAWLPWFAFMILDPLEKNGFQFKTTTNILKVDCPIMILHAEDDSIIPYTLGMKLSEVASTERNLTIQGNVTYHQFAARHRYNHLNINAAPELPTHIEEFKMICEEYNLGKG